MQRPRRYGAALALCAAALIAGCSTAPERSEARLEQSTTTTAGTTEPTTSPAPTTGGEPSPAELVRRAVAEARDGYAFEAGIVVDDEEVGAFEGRYRPGAAEVTVTIAGARVHYVLTDEGRWVNDGDEWLPLEGDLALSDPLGDLGVPIEATRISSSPLVLEAVYEGSVLGVETDRLPVRMTLIDGLIVEVSYEQPLGTRIARVTTTLDYRLDGPPITVPTP